MTPRERRETAIRLMADGSPVSTGQAAALLSVDVTTVSRWCRSGDIVGAFRTRVTSGHWRVPASEVARRVLGDQGEEPRS